MRIDLHENLWCIDQCDSHDQVSQASEIELLLRKAAIIVEAFYGRPSMAKPLLWKLASGDSIQEGARL